MAGKESKDKEKEEMNGKRSTHKNKNQTYGVRPKSGGTPITLVNVVERPTLHRPLYGSLTDVRALQRLTLITPLTGVIRHITPLKR